MEPIERLKAVDAPVSSLCVLSPDQLAIGSEAGSLTVIDLTQGQVSQTISLPAAPSDEADASVASVCSVQHVLYAAVGSEVRRVDLREPSQGVTLLSCQDEVNQVCLNSKAAYLATADDTGTVQVWDVAAGRVFRRIEDAHSNIAACVAFRPHRPWELISGGMDMTVARWDFSRGKRLDRLTFTGVGGAQLFNPPFIHTLAVPPVTNACRPWSQLLAIGCGDGSVSLLDADKPLTLPPPPSHTDTHKDTNTDTPPQPHAEPTNTHSVSSPSQPSNTQPSSKASVKGSKQGRHRPRSGTAQTGSGPVSNNTHSSASTSHGTQRAQVAPAGSSSRDVWPCVWDQLGGGHTRAVSSVVFSWARLGGAEEQAGVCGSGGAADTGPGLLVSGGVDRRILGWAVQHTHTHNGGSHAHKDSSGTQGTASAKGSDRQAAPEASVGAGSVSGKGVACPLFDIKHGRKVNCLAAGVGSGQNLLYLGDTSKRVAVYDLSKTLQQQAV